jgi:hypothetical protein
MSTKLRKKLIIFSASFVLLAFLIDKLIEFGLTNNYFSMLGKINLIVEHKIDPEIIVFGASTAQVGVNTPLMSKITKKTCFNAAIDGTTLKQYQCLIQHYNQYSKKNKLVIFVVSPFALFSNDKLTAIERYLPHIDDQYVYSSLSGIDPYLTMKCRYVPLYKYTQVTSNYYFQSISGWKHYFKNDSKILMDPQMGYTPVSQSWQRDQDEKNKQTPKVKMEIDSVVVNLYARVLNDLKKENRNVVILFPPIQKDGLSRIEGFDQLIDSYNKLSKDTGFLFLNYANCYISGDKGYFYNNSHLNKKGSEVFTEMLSKEIIDLIE